MPVNNATNVLQRDSSNGNDSLLYDRDWMLRQLELRDPSSSAGDFLRQLRIIQRHGGHAPARHLSEEFDAEEPCPLAGGHSGELSGSDCGEGLDEEDGLTWPTDAAEDPGLQRDYEEASTSAPMLPPGPCSYLRVGQMFQGAQRLTTHNGRRQEDWQVEVCIQAYDPASGYVCGVMEALNVPMARSPVVTFWEGEIVDNVNHSFTTRQWGADRTIDKQHWSKFEGYAALRHGVDQHAGRSPALAACPCVFMRWKEQYFVSQADLGLTISGFYYVCLNRLDGKLQGFYYDQHSVPFQELDMQPKPAAAQAGVAFASYCLR